MNAKKKIYNKMFFYLCVFACAHARVCAWVCVRAGA